jgi:hypothetical protein
MASILTNSVGSSQVEGGPDLAEGHSTILTRMRMYREVNWASSEGGGSLGSVGKGKVGTAKAALCVKVDPRECAKPLTKFWASPGTRQVSDPLVTSSAENEISISSYAYLVVRTHPCFLTGSENIIRQANSTADSLLASSPENPKCSASFLLLRMRFFDSIMWMIHELHSTEWSALGNFISTTIEEDST